MKHTFVGLAARAEAAAGTLGLPIWDVTATNTWDDQWNLAVWGGHRSFTADNVYLSETPFSAEQGVALATQLGVKDPNVEPPRWQGGSARIDGVTADGVHVVIHAQAETKPASGGDA